MSIFAFMRRYGHYIFLLPIVLLLIDEIINVLVFNSHETARQIALEDFIEDAAIILAVVFWRWMKSFFTRRPYHCLCPHCHFEWVTYKDAIPEVCQHCGKRENAQP